MKNFKNLKLNVNKNEEKIDEETEKMKINEVNKKGRINNKLLINCIIFISILVMTFGILLYYPKIKEISNSQETTPYDNHMLLENINDCNMILYKDIVEKTSESEMSVESIYINSYTEEYNYDNEYYGEKDSTRYVNNVLNPLQSKVYSIQSKLDFDLRNLEYAAMDKDGNVVINRGFDEIQGMSSYDNLKDSYGFYVVINYDNNGFPVIKDYYGADFNYIKNAFSKNIDTNQARNYNGFKINYNKITDTTIVYGIPKDLKYSDEISDIVNERSNNYVDQDIVMIFGFVVGCIILLIGLLLPYKIEKEIIGFKSLLKIPFEIGCIFYSAFSGIMIFLGFGLVMITLNGAAKIILGNLRLNSSFDNTIIYFANIALWIITIYFILSGMTYLKQIFKYGFKRYVKERVLLVRGFQYILRKTESFLDYLSHIDLSDKSNRVIIKVLLANFIIISVISIIWMFGIFAAIVYNIILFILIRKYYDKVRDNYSQLLKATNKIAHGNLDFEINEDLGLFNPFKYELKKIQSGFKKAVDEEVKSQKMKTELISNVSHDLKTPLTSIITYIDLLKNDNITDEERSSYIDTIDKKSQRLKFLIEDLFEVSKATSGNIKLNPVNVDIIELIKQVEIELSNKLDNAKVIVKNSFPNSKVILNLDSQKTFRVFENLLNNVAKYSMPGSRVYIDVNENIDNVEIAIKNMSAVEIDYKAEEIVERFQRGDKSRNTEGSGLGLAIVKSFVEAQGGTFKVELDGDLFKTIINFRRNK